MKTLYYITRTYPTKVDKDGSCALLRVGAVNFLSSKFNVIVITTNYENEEVIEDSGIIRIPISNKELKIGRLFERVGIYEDYLNIWIKRCVSYLEKIINRDSIVFSTCGGDLASIKIAAILKRKIGCKFVINFRDPALYTKIGKEKFGDRITHVCREKYIEKYIKITDLIITSSMIYKDILVSKYPYIQDKIINNYFGYPEIINEISNKDFKDKIHTIVYGGSMSNFQKPEIMYEYLKNLKELKKVYIGDYMARKNIYKLEGKDDVQLIKKLSHREYIDYIFNNATLGFVSLYGDKLKACVPSKIYEYINLEIPILGALPNGDAMDLINNGGYGIACRYDDPESIKKAAKDLLVSDRYFKIKKKLHDDKKIWAMEHRIKEIFPYLEKL